MELQGYYPVMKAGFKSRLFPYHASRITAWAS